MARKNAIAFGLVHIPIKYDNAVQSHSISFHQLHKDTKERIKYQKVAPKSKHFDVAATDIVKAYEYEKDHYIEMSEQELESLKTEKDKKINILTFVDMDEIDPIFFEKAYYCYPDGSDKAFTLFKKALKNKNKVAIAKTVLGTKENLVALRLFGDTLLMETMYYLDEIRQKPDEIANIQILPREMEMAENLIESMSENFQPELYEDEYQNRLKQAIFAKIEGKKISSYNKVEENNVANLMEALKASVEQMQTMKNRQPSPKKVKK